MEKPRIVSVKEKGTEGQSAGEAPATPEKRPEAPQLATGPPWVQRGLIEARKRELPKSAEEVIEEQAKEIIPTVPEPGQPIEVGGEKKKGIANRLFGWLFK